MVFGRIGRVFSGVALIDIGGLDCFAGLDLDPLGEFGDLGSILPIGYCYTQCKAMSQGINRQMDFGAFATFRPVVAGAATALHTGLWRPAVEDCSRRRFLPAFGDSQRCAQVVGERFKDLSFDPSPRLLVDDMPGWQVVKHYSPSGTTMNRPAQAVEYLAQRIIALRSVFSH
jgi:hypothetical protein